MAMWFIAPLMAVVTIAGLLVIALVLIPALQGKDTRLHQSERQLAEETRMIQELHQQLSRMEERVEALETILAGRGKEGRKG